MVTGGMITGGGFNPRAREGRDLTSHRNALFIFVSIHAPARGATSGELISGLSSSGFNPRAREGRDGA